MQDSLLLIVSSEDKDKDCVQGGGMESCLCKAYGLGPVSCITGDSERTTGRGGKMDSLESNLQSDSLCDQAGLLMGGSMLEVSSRWGCVVVLFVDLGGGRIGSC
jgi:hypothetical protein